MLSIPYILAFLLTNLQGTYIHSHTRTHTHTPTHTHTCMHAFLPTYIPTYLQTCRLIELKPQKLGTFLGTAAKS